MEHHYKSWSGIKKELLRRVCPSLKGRIDYFLTYYHDVHNAYGRASIRVDGTEKVSFTWVDRYKQEKDVYAEWEKSGQWDYSDKKLKEKWDKEGILSDYDFLHAVTEFLQMKIEDALQSENFLVRIFAILDGRVGKRTLEKLKRAEEYLYYPDWVKSFYRLRFDTVSEPKNAIYVKTERLCITVATQKQMENIIESQTDTELKTAYLEMLNESLKHREECQWYAVWMIDLHDGTHIGELCFKGVQANGMVEIGCGIMESYRKQGYATEAVRAVSEWALQQKGIAGVEAETEVENFASQKVLTKSGFVAIGQTGREGLLYRRSKDE